MWITRRLFGNMAMTQMRNAAEVVRAGAAADDTSRNAYTPRADAATSASIPSTVPPVLTRVSATAGRKRATIQIQVVVHFHGVERIEHPPIPDRRLRLMDAEKGLWRSHYDRQRYGI